jgi:hypothetical protein
MLFREIIVDYGANRTKHTSTLCAQNAVSAFKALGADRITGVRDYMKKKHDEDEELQKPE